MNSRIKFSVIMPAYNRAFCIANAIDSLLAQSYAKWELIIVDDGSTDNTTELVRQKYARYLQNKQIRYYTTKHRGVSAARNLGLAKAKADWIAYLDTDNTLCHDFLATFAAAIRAHPQCRIFYAKAQADGRIIGREFDRQALTEANFIDLGTFVHHKSLPNLYGNFNPALNRLVDWDLILRYTQNTTPIFLPCVVLNYNDSNAFARISNTESFAANQQIIQELHHTNTPKTKENTMFLLKMARFFHLISKRKYTERRAINLFKKSALFNHKWYLQTYTDVAQAQMEPERHYWKYGWLEGRNPSPLFDGNAYLAQNPDVVAAQICPLEHYLRYGAPEGRSYTAVSSNTAGNSADSAEKTTIWHTIGAVLTYPLRVHEEYERLRAEIKMLQNTK